MLWLNDQTTRCYPFLEKDAIFIKVCLIINGEIGLLPKASVTKIDISNN